MSDIRFEWDAVKDASNQKKHGISFSEAKTVFSDQFARLIADPDHSDEEDRFILTWYQHRFKIACRLPLCKN